MSSKYTNLHISTSFMFFVAILSCMNWRGVAKLSKTFKSNDIILWKFNSYLFRYKSFVFITFRKNINCCKVFASLNLKIALTTNRSKGQPDWLTDWLELNWCYKNIKLKEIIPFQNKHSLKFEHDTNSQYTDDTGIFSVSLSKIKEITHLIYVLTILISI